MLAVYPETNFIMKALALGLDVLFEVEDDCSAEALAEKYLRSTFDLKSG